MVNSLLFRWEDSQALQHHCGFCERPLSHPGARASCFGTHSEPCHRFHQAMFMRNRAHMCNYCSTIDEAHYKRHHDLVDQLRGIYESCAESDWTIVPVEPGDPRQARSSNTQTADSDQSDRNDRSFTTEETPTSRRERKDAKCLIRAANRTKVVTQEEIRYVDSVLHSSEDVANGDLVSPANMEEMQLIEKNLRYNANIYNSHSSPKALKRFAKIPEVEVNFERELERVLDTFRITELVKRNLRNRGLQGKELKSFEVLVDVFRNAVVEDLVLVKKDMMEIRMRRAGYLRYTNKTAYSIVEDRYTEKDWKTGERIKSSASESSGLSSSSEEPFSSSGHLPDMPIPANSSTSGPDRRHLQRTHTRISGDDGLSQKAIEPYHIPLSSLTPDTTMKKPTILQLKVVENKKIRIPAGMTNCGWMRRDEARQIALDRPFRASEVDKLPPSPLPVNTAVVDPEITQIKPAWSRTGAVSSLRRLTPEVDKHQFPPLGLPTKKTQHALLHSDALSVQLPVEDVTRSLQGPEYQVLATEDVDNRLSAVSQKRAKKAQREAKRKAKKMSELPKKKLTPTTEDDDKEEDGEVSFAQAAHDPCEGLANKRTRHDDLNVVTEISPQSLRDSLAKLIDTIKDDVSITTAEKQCTAIGTPLKPSSASLPHSTRGKHDHWIRFLRQFTVDQLTPPLLQTFEGCSHGSSCRFESHAVPDCPFHKPHCSCVDPMLDQCYLVYPGKQPCSVGPYNRVQGQRFMALYEQHDLTRGRVMLVDDDIVSYFMDPDTSPGSPDLGSMPLRLVREYTEYLDGYGRGMLMKQEAEFERLVLKNVTSQHGLTTKMFQDIQRQHDKTKHSVRLCYCSIAVSLEASEIKKEFGSSLVVCSYHKCNFGGVFHKRCVRKLGVEKVSRWYCTACEEKMKMRAYKALNIPYKFCDVFKAYTDEEKAMAKKLLAQMAQTCGVMDRSKSRLQKLFSMNDSEGLGIEDFD